MLVVVITNPQSCGFGSREDASRRSFRRTNDESTWRRVGSLCQADPGESIHLECAPERCLRGPIPPTFSSPSARPRRFRRRRFEPFRFPTTPGPHGRSPIQDPHTGLVPPRALRNRCRTVRRPSGTAQSRLLHRDRVPDGSIPCRCSGPPSCSRPWCDR